MPSTVVDFSHSNAAPVAVAGPAHAGTADAPVARALGAELGAHTNAAPAARALGAELGAPSNAAPGVVPPPSYAGTAATPEARALPIATTGTASVPQMVGWQPTLPPPTDETMHTPALIFSGRLTQDQVFGFYKTPAAVVVKGVQLSAQTAPTGSAATIELIDSEGGSLGRTASLPAGQSFADVTFVTPLPLAANTQVRAKVTAVGSGTAGGYLTASLIVQVA